MYYDTKKYLCNRWKWTSRGMLWEGGSFYFPWIKIHNLKPNYSQTMFQDFFYEQSHFTYQFDCVSTETDSSDGSEDCFVYVPQMTKYKTESCKKFSLMGYCSYGDRCLFAHGNFERQPFYCGSLYKTKKCNNFWKKGFCLYGIRCQFLHSELERPLSQ